MKIAHPEPTFREVAEEACRSIGTMVEKYILFSVKYWVTWFCGFVLQEICSEGWSTSSRVWDGLCPPCTAALVVWELGHPGRLLCAPAQH